MYVKTNLVSLQHQNLAWKFLSGSNVETLIWYPYCVSVWFSLTENWEKWYTLPLWSAIKSTNERCYIKTFPQGWSCEKNVFPVRKIIKLSSIHLPCINVISKKIKRNLYCIWAFLSLWDTRGGKKKINPFFHLLWTITL